MNSRTYDPSRLFYLLKVFCFTITLLALIVVAVSLYEQHVLDLLEEVRKAKADSYWWDLQRTSDYNFAGSLVTKGLIVAVGTPILFFLTTSLYKYLFPLKVEKQNNKTSNSN